jgi:hypothetical protein
MYLDDEHFDKWMERLSDKLGDISKLLKLLVDTDKVFDKDDTLMDNQDVALLLKVSPRTIQRYRAEGKLRHFFIGQKVYYRASDVREFIYRHGGCNEEDSSNDKTTARKTPHKLS